MRKVFELSFWRLCISSFNLYLRAGGVAVSGEYLCVCMLVFRVYSVPDNVLGGGDTCVSVSVLVVFGMYSVAVTPFATGTTLNVHDRTLS